MSDSKHEDSHEENSSPSLSDMPIHILTRVVNELDFPSRTKLQRTCHGFQDFINSHNSTCQEMILTFKGYSFRRLQLDWSMDQFNVQYIKRQNDCLVKVGKEEKEKLLNDSDFLEIGLADFKSAIKNPKFKVKNLSIQLVLASAFVSYRAMDHFFNKISKTLESLDQKLKVEKLSIHTYNKEKYAYSILKYIEPEKLKEICIGFYIYENYPSWPNRLLTINQLTSLEQWKTAKSLRINNLCLDIPVESIIHFDEFAGSLKSLSPENIKFLKEVYLQSDTFKSCYVETEDDFNSINPNFIDIEEVDNLLGPIVPIDQNRPDVRHYTIPNSNQWLLMEITPESFHIYRTDCPTFDLVPPLLSENPIHSDFRFQFHA